MSLDRMEMVYVLRAHGGPKIHRAWCLNGWNMTCEQCLVINSDKIRTSPKSLRNQSCWLWSFLKRSMVQYILVSVLFLFVCDLLTAIRLDINPNNIFLSSIDMPSPVVKVGDLGNSEHLLRRTPGTMLILAVLQEGYDKIRVQSLPTRAPEVWRGLGCWHSSDVWSVGVTVSRITSITTLADCEVGTLVVSIYYFWGQGQDSRRTYRSVVSCKDPAADRPAESTHQQSRLSGRIPAR